MRLIDDTQAELTQDELWLSDNFDELLSEGLGMVQAYQALLDRSDAHYRAILGQPDFKNWLIGSPPPPDPFNPHRNRTADGVLITHGLRVYTNNLDQGIVVGKRCDGDLGKETDWWWDVKLDTNWHNQPMDDTAMMNGERMTVRKPRF